MRNELSIPAPETTFDKEGITTLFQWRAAIISSTMNHGLVAGDALVKQGWPVLSSGYPPAPCIGGYTFHTFYGDFLKTQKNIQGNFYQYADGILQLLAERRLDFYWWNQPREAQAAIAEARINSSFLVVCDKKDRSIHEWTENIPASEIYAFVFPGDIWKEYQEQSGKQSEGGTKVVTVDEKVEKPVPYDYGSLSVPNYEGALMEVLTERFGNMFVRVGRKKAYKDPDIWVHGVRLPIEDDLHRLKQPAL